MARVLVAGAYGLLGPTLCEALQAAGHAVLRLGRGAGDEIRADLGDPAQAERALREAGADVVVNLAGLTDVDRCEREPQAAYEGNVRPAENLCAALPAGKACTLVHLSTDQVYDAPGPSDEGRVVLRNTYAYSKYAAEWAVRAAGGVILRTNFVGPAGASPRRSFSDWIVETARQGRPATLFADVLFSPLSMATLSAMVLAVIRAPVAGTYNVGARDGMSKADFALALLRELGLPAACFRVGSAADLQLAARRPSDMRMAVERFARAYRTALPALADEIRLLARQHAEKA